ncbi:MAG TPA: hypothetical protein VF708_13360 [Pyrinomonadaceae bacterium]|jgi:hypothetical protein
MTQTLTGYLRVRRANGLRAVAKRFIAALALALILPASAFAYTVVLRSGRCVEIPSVFSATRTTLTYQYAPGIYITLQMSTIDMAATDRANNEPSGSFLKRMEQQQQATPPQAANGAGAVRQTPSRRTLTDRDLEASRRARQQSEEAYERRRIELGLPSREETEARRVEESERAREQLRLAVEEEAQAEAYWRSRASQLRAEIAATDGEINYLRARLAETPDPFSNGSYTVLTTVAPLLPFNQGLFPHAFPHFPVTRSPLATFNRGIIGHSAVGAQINGRIGFGGGGTRGQVLINPHGTVTPFGQHLAATAFGLRRGLGSPVFPLPLTVVGTSFPYQYYSYEREALVVRLDELAARRAGLQARWKVLEDEARRAGALPGWLR